MNKEEFEQAFKLLSGVHRVCRHKNFDIGLIENYRKSDYIIEFHLEFKECNFEMKEYASLVFCGSFDESKKYDDVDESDITRVIDDIDEFISKVNKVADSKVNLLSDVIGALENE